MNKDQIINQVLKEAIIKESGTDDKKDKKDIKFSVKSANKSRAKAFAKEAVNRLNDTHRSQRNRKIYVWRNSIEDKNAKVKNKKITANYNAIYVTFSHPNFIGIEVIKDTKAVWTRDLAEIVFETIEKEKPKSKVFFEWPTAQEERKRIEKLFKKIMPNLK